MKPQPIAKYLKDLSKPDPEMDALRHRIIDRIIAGRAHGMIGELGITLNIIEDEFRRFGRE